MVLFGYLYNINYLEALTRVNEVLLQFLHGGTLSPLTQVISFLQSVHLYIPDVCTVEPVDIVVAIFSSP